MTLTTKTVYTPRTKKTEYGYLAIIDAYQFNDMGQRINHIPFYGVASYHDTRAAAMKAARRLKDIIEAEG